jgi:hypothetical protein
MRLLITISGVIMFAGCGTPDSIERLTGYVYPLDSLTEGKVFTFRDEKTDDVLLIKRKKVIEDGATYIDEEMSKKYATAAEFVSMSSARIVVDGKGDRYIAYSEYTLEDTVLVKVPAKIKALKNVYDGKKYRGTHLSWVIGVGGFWRRFTSDEVFDRQDTLQVGNTATDALVFSTRFTYVLKNRYFPFNTITEKNGVGENQYARNMGLVKFTQQGDGFDRSWRLESITSLE